MTGHEILAILATILAGMVRTSVGVGSGIALTASLSLLFNPHLTLAIMAFLQIGLGASALIHYWKRWDSTLVLRLVGWIFLGVLAGTWLVNVVPTDWARRVLGAALGAAAILELLRSEHVATSRAISRAPAALSGFASGVAGSTANACGAVAAIYLKRHPLSHDGFLSTLTTVVLIHDVFRLGVFWQFDMLTAQAFGISIMLLPFAFAGAWIGTHVRALASERLLRNAVLGLVLVVGIALLR